MFLPDFLEENRALSARLIKETMSSLFKYSVVPILMVTETFSPGAGVKTWLEKAFLILSPTTHAF